jgi:DNA polymerase-3 subunit delta'
MSSIDSFSAAFDGLRQGFESGRTAHAYLVVGSPRGNALALAESFLQLLFCSAKDRPCGECRECLRVKSHEHPDIMWLHPESKSRRIDIEQIREELNPRMTQTSYGGGWKAGVLVHADRMTDAAANAFLKTLEEPPGRTVLLLLSDAPQHLLPTIVSRCQRVVLGGGQEELEGPWVEPLLEVLRSGVPASLLEARLQAGLLKQLLDTVKESAAEGLGEEATAEQDEDILEARVAARVVEVRSDIMRAILLWRRDVLLKVLGMDDRFLHFQNELDVLARQARGLKYADALADLRAVEAMVSRLERNLPPESVFGVGLAARLG